MGVAVGPRKIAVGDLGEFWYGDYKEPFVQLEGAVEGHPQGALLRTERDPAIAKLLCARCGAGFDNLASHVRLVHGESAREYKEFVGLLAKSALISERVREARIRTALRNKGRGGWANRANLTSAGALAARSHPTGLAKPEWQNKTGRCKAQILHVAQAIVRERGRVTRTELAHRGIWARNIEEHFGSMDNLRRAVGDMASPKVARFPDATLLMWLRTTAAKLGRSPFASDLRREGLPDISTYQRHFGSLAAAIDRAGLPPARMIPTTEEAAILSAYAVTGSIGAVRKSQGRGFATIQGVLAKYGVPIIRGHDSHEIRRRAREQAAEIAARLEGLATDMERAA